MKTLILCFMLLSSLIADKNLIAGIDQTLQKIIKTTTDKTFVSIAIDYDPFFVNARQSVQASPETDTNMRAKVAQANPSVPVLSMIFDKKALINGEWVKENMKVADYVVTTINQDTVILKKKNKYFSLKLPYSDSVLTLKEVKK